MSGSERLETTNIEMIPANKLFVDKSYHRPPEGGSAWLTANIVENFQADALGALTVSERGRDTYAIVDGAGRWYALHTLMNKQDYLLPCIVRHGLTHDDEAHLYLVLNTHTPTRRRTR
jgi:hypothetical protein